jgi:hypothetical protein
MPEYTFKHWLTGSTLRELLERLTDEAREAELLGMHFRRHGDAELASKYEARAEARHHIISTVANQTDLSIRGRAISYARAHELRLPMDPELMDTDPLLDAVEAHRAKETDNG